MQKLKALDPIVYEAHKKIKHTLEIVRLFVLFQKTSLVGTLDIWVWSRRVQKVYSWGKIKGCENKERERRGTKFQT